MHVGGGFSRNRRDLLGAALEVSLIFLMIFWRSSEDGKGVLPSDEAV
jgi:hypothetical protein